METPIRVLMIEDDEEDFLIASRLLASAGPKGFLLERRDCLREGLSAIGLETQVVLLDLSLPDSRGWATFERVREKAPHIPIILLTGLDDEQLGAKAVQGGAQDYLVKGQFDGRLLARAIRYAIERKITEERLSHLADELRAANAVMAADLAMAREVQGALVPRQPPRRSDGGRMAPLRVGMLYRPCQTLGGDFFAFLPVSETEIGMVICDVVGHGVRSALVTALLRGLVEEFKLSARDPGRFLTQVNREFLKVLNMPDCAMLVTAACVFLDLRAGVSRGATAGHPPPLRLKASGSAEWLPLHGEAIGPALGFDASFEYRAVDFSLDVGDRLLLYTDGAYESCAPTYEEYGRERLLAAAAQSGRRPVEELPDRILADLQGFVGKGEFTDDLCLVCIERGALPSAGGGT
ncbi:MAG: response regulator [Lentisphaerae bacterium]|nr:response regulator [Lentisphaerota bacterium]